MTRLRALCWIGLTACKPDATTPPATDEQSEAAGPIDCPEGTRVRGEAPPEGNRVWCETEAGVSHGPFLSWHDNGRKKAQGSFRNGSAQGEWTSWYDNGQLRSKGSYEAGDRVGRWKSFAQDGTPQPLEPRPDTARVDEPLPAWDLHVGIPICDQYVSAYTRCIETKAPEAIREVLRDAIAQTVEVWRQAADGPDREALADSCRMALEAARQASAAWGCEF